MIYAHVKNDILTLN